MSAWKPKKYLGQHFLKDLDISKQIVEAIKLPLQDPSSIVLEIGPGKGALTHFLVQKQFANLYLVEIDSELVSYLLKTYPILSNHIIEADFIKLDLTKRWVGPISVVGNFPYNISSQIFFKLLQHRDQVKEIVCMVQKEVAERIIAQPGSKAYGIPSVFLQAFYNINYLFTVGPDLFMPPPKVNSAVIRLERNELQQLPCNENLFSKLVKLGFQQRRKKLKNALSAMILPAHLVDLPQLNQRAEELSISDFIALTQEIGAHIA
ncbi:MAG: 16S rRNA (adenine(1518)-N(6)/adenine(1519)-N(6))-dimethyltransferase [Candidatus Amoebophilus sp. 36-38]|nr:MAG: 16S rRNA (adenine(1518)-N(6)/adenine(1519)-N(6))-dimethyltransferase [Candidatus Amoebophilus sp. 36-38]